SLSHSPLHDALPTFYLTVAVLSTALLGFAVLGLRARRADGLLDDYVTARNSQSAQAIGLSFLASGMGAWILFAPPEIGAFVGPRSEEHTSELQSREK